VSEQTWSAVWERRTLDRGASTLEALMRADGLDTGFGNVSEAAWRAFSERVGDRLGVGAGTRVFEVGCGAGAFLWPLAQRGASVAGLDGSATLVGYAREAMPDGRFVQSDARDLDTTETFDVVLACGVFMYFPHESYAAEVVAKMAAKSTRALAILDVPDRATRDAALAHRRGTLGPEEYAKKYAGLDHLFLDRAWLETQVKSAGFTHVATEDQRVDGYANAAFRFNVFASR